jgi:hypothetical protein
MVQLFPRDPTELADVGSLAAIAAPAGGCTWIHVSAAGGVDGVWAAGAPRSAEAGGDEQCDAPPKHPGIVFVDDDGSERSEPAWDLPESIAWATLDGERIPVVRVEQTGSGDFIEITRFGPDRRFVDRTAGSEPRQPLPEADAIAAPEPPWQIRYHDGSSNAYVFWRAARGGAARHRYQPVTPEQSSSGSYDGGAAASGSLPRGAAMELWKRVRALEDDSSSHTDRRTKGTGVFEVTAAGTRKRFRVRASPALQAFEEFLAPYRGARSSDLPR